MSDYTDNGTGVAGLEECFDLDAEPDPDLAKAVNRLATSTLLLAVAVLIAGIRRRA